MILFVSRFPDLGYVLTCLQIAVYDAIPFQEFTQNPYTVLLTTSLGGHLSWFEIGGGRWHARPVCDLLSALTLGLN